MLLNPRYGSVGVLAIPYYFSFEFLDPAIRVVGYIFFAVGLLLGVLNLEFAAAFFLAAVGLGALLSILASFLRRVATEALPALVGPPEAYDLGNAGELRLPAGKHRVAGADDRVVSAQSESFPENSGRPLIREV